MASSARPGCRSAWGTYVPKKTLGMYTPPARRKPTREPTYRWHAHRRPDRPQGARPRVEGTARYPPREGTIARTIGALPSREDRTPEGGALEQSSATEPRFQRRPPRLGGTNGHWQTEKRHRR